jgi:hypothetical protein
VDDVHELNSVRTFGFHSPIAASKVTRVTDMELKEIAIAGKLQNGMIKALVIQAGSTLQEEEFWHSQ